MDLQNFADRIRKLISQNKIDVAIQELSFLLRNNKKLDEVVIASAKYDLLQKEIRIGIINNSDAETKRNKIIIGLLDMLHELDESMQKDEKLKAEIDSIEEPNIVASKNVISEKAVIRSSGDLLLGDINLSTSGSTEDTNRIINRLKNHKKS